MENKIYEKAINIITSREKFHICLGLERISKILNLIGNPQDKLNVIHIAGTNGKGSTSAILSKILTCANYKTGLYTSPHILDYTERIKINNIDISKNDFAQLVFEISDIAKNNDIYLTEFELITVCAFKYFHDKDTDICVIETGLGGRLDATNAIKSNIASIITSISLDHTDRLGNTIEQIATEKAGIIKNGSATIIAKDNQGYSVIEKIAKSQNSKIFSPQNPIKLNYENNKNYAIYNEKNYEFNLLGLWQQKNLELVFACIEYLKSIDFSIEEQAITKALKTVSWPCRMQYIQKYNLLIDGTHNPDGAKVLKESLNYYFPNQKRIWVYGSLNTKDYKSVMQTLFQPNDEVYFYNFQYPNSVSFEDLHNTIGKGRLINQRELEYFITENKDSLIIISGSFYMIGNILKSENFPNFVWDCM
jgi:dihydrofolate synthase/folylpolyglutamate synthase